MLLEKKMITHGPDSPSTVHNRTFVLTVAGSDSGGGAGIQGDLKTCSALGCYAATVITAVTAQNSCGVQAVEPLGPDVVEQQLRAVMEDLPISAAKTGMLATAAIVRRVAKVLAEYRTPNLVVDPVLISTSGTRLLSEDGVEVLQRELIPQARLLTPNLAEVGALLGAVPQTVGEMQQAARRLAAFGCQAVLVKGGHLEKDLDAVDVLCDGREVLVLSKPRLAVEHSHGTGCALSAAIACGLGLGRPLREAVTDAKAYLHGALQHAYPIGKGKGPVNHLWQRESEA